MPYTKEQLESALMKAHQSGNKEHARILVQEIKKLQEVSQETQQETPEQPTEQDVSFMGKLSQDYDARSKKYEQIQERYQRESQEPLFNPQLSAWENAMNLSPAQLLLTPEVKRDARIAANVGIGGAMDVAGRLIEASGAPEVAGNLYKEYTPEAIQKGMSFIGSQLDEAVKYGKENLSPDTQMDLEALYNTMSVMSPTFKVSKNAKRIQETLREDKLKKTFMPEETRMEQATRIEHGGGLKPHEQQMIQDLKDIKGLKMNDKDYQHNADVLNVNIGSLNNKLEKALSKNQSIINRFDIEAEGNALASQVLKNNPLLKSSETGMKMFGDIQDNFNNIVKSRGDKINLKQLLDIRRDFDTMIYDKYLKNLGKNDQTLRNELTSVAQLYRNKLNDIIAMNEPNIDVKKNLAKQSSLITAKHNVAFKGTGFNEPKTMLGKVRAFAERHPYALTSALTSGVGSIGGQLMLGAGAGLLGVSAYKALSKPQIRNNLIASGISGGTADLIRDSQAEDNQSGGW